MMSRIDGVVVVLLRGVQAVRPGVREVDGESFGAQAALQRGRQPDLVLDDQQPHLRLLISVACTIACRFGQPSSRDLIQRCQGAITAESPFRTAQPHHSAIGASSSRCECQLQSCSVTMRCAGWFLPGSPASSHSPPAASSTPAPRRICRRGQPRSCSPTSRTPTSTGLSGTIVGKTSLGLPPTAGARHRPRACSAC